jgi:hypothetical protein
VASLVLKQQKRQVGAAPWNPLIEGRSAPYGTQRVILAVTSRRSSWHGPYRPAIRAIATLANNGRTRDARRTMAWCGPEAGHDAGCRRRHVHPVDEDRGL